MLKLGIIGTNIITDQMLDAAKTTGQYQLTAVYSRTLTRAKEYGEPYGATAFYDSLEDFFDEGDFDVVYIASPNSKHYEQARLAIENDKFVILEKPAFVNPEEFSRIESLLAAHPKARLVEAARHIHTGLFHAGEDQLKKMDTIQGANITVMKYSSRYDKVLPEHLHAGICRGGFDGPRGLRRLRGGDPVWRAGQRRLLPNHDQVWR